MKEYWPLREAIIEVQADQSLFDIDRTHTRPISPFRLSGDEHWKKLGSGFKGNAKRTEVTRAWRDASPTEREKYFELAMEEEQIYKYIKQECKKLLIDLQG